MMDHEQVLELLPAYIDNELGLIEARAIAHHLDSCTHCWQAYDVQRSVSARLKAAYRPSVAPPELLTRIRNSLAGQPSLWRRLTAPARLNPAWPIGLSTGLMVLTALLLTWGNAIYIPAAANLPRLTQEVIDDHIRSLQVDHLFDVMSTDRHTVKPWFDGKLDYAPPVVDLAAQGYPLVGARLDYMDARNVAVLVYRYQRHPINLYVWPTGTSERLPPSASTTADTSALPNIIQRQGYVIAHWRSGSMTYWAITDAGATELRAFIQALRAHPVG